MKIFTTVIFLTALMTPLSAQWLQRRTPGIPRTADGKPNLTAPAPRTADGKPDLAGLWQMISPDGAVGNVSLRKAGDLQSADIQPWAHALVQQRAENFGIENPRYKCLPDGLLCEESAEKTGKFLYIYLEPFANVVCPFKPA